MESGRDHRRGALFGLLAAAAFGISAPLAKILLGGVEPVLLAALLYAGAAAGLWTQRWLAAPTTEASLRREDLPRLVAIALLGGAAGPVLMLLGLGHASGAAAALLLNLEAPLTMLLAALVFGEYVGLYAASGMALVLTGAALLAIGEPGGGSDLAGIALIASACLCWAVDNNLTQTLTLRDPFAVVRFKATSAALLNGGLAMALGAPLPSATSVVAALLLGSVSYGASIVLDAYALRLVGAAREAALFATAPFLGVTAAWLLGEHPTTGQFLAIVAMAAGVAALLKERHAHRHHHDVLEHEHLHEHDAHHQHVHAPGVPVAASHSHWHRHEAMDHEHPHLPDLHHRHPH